MKRLRGSVFHFIHRLSYLLVACVYAASSVGSLRIGMPAISPRAFGCSARVDHFGFVFGGETPSGLLDEMQLLDLHRMRWTEVRSTTVEQPPPLRSCTLSALPPRYQPSNSSWSISKSAYPIVPGVPDSWPATRAMPAAAQLVLLDSRAARTNAAKFVSDRIALKQANFPDEFSENCVAWVFDTATFGWQKYATTGSTPARLAHAAVSYFNHSAGRYMILIHGGKALMLVAGALVH